MAGTSEVQPGGTWQVTGQLEQTKINAAGRVVEGVQVLFTTGTGSTGSVWIPRNLFTPDAVRAAVSAAAANVDAVATLTSGG